MNKSLLCLLFVTACGNSALVEHEFLDLAMFHAEIVALLGVTVSGDSTCMTRAINGRVDLSITDFIQPFIDATPVSPEGPIPLDMVCASPCTASTDCPAAMTCLPDDKGIGRCEIAGN